MKQDDRWSEDGEAYYKTFLMAPRRAERAELHGYLSEGIRIIMEMPRRGLEWTSEYQVAWAASAIDNVLRANPNFRVIDSSPISFSSLHGTRYSIAGTDARISEPETTSIIFISDPRFLLTVELASPTSQFDYYLHRLTSLLSTLEIIDPQAPW